MELAESVSKLSHCSRLQVGCVIATTDYKQILAWGYNGSGKGLSNSCDTDIPGSCGCLHAECNAVINCQASRLEDKFVFVTTLPCTNCAKIIINLGNVKKVFYRNSYRTNESLKLFKKCKIKVGKI